MRLAAAGDAAAFARLLAPVEPALRTVIRAALAGRSDLDVEEVLQDTRIYLLARLDRFNPEYPFVVFARGLARTIVRRHRGARRDLAPGTGADDEDDGFTGELSPAELAALPAAAARVLGSDRFAPPDGPPGPSLEFLELFEALLSRGGYPHQQLCFGFSILLWGRRDPRTTRDTDPAGGGRVPITGDPDRVVTELGAETLAPTARRFFQEMAEGVALEPTYLARVRLPFDERLRLTGEALFATDAAARRAYAALRDEIIGATRLNDYCGRNPRQSVADWTRNVKERLRRHYCGDSRLTVAGSQNPAPPGV